MLAQDWYLRKHYLRKYTVLGSYNSQTEAFMLTPEQQKTIAEFEALEREIAPHHKRCLEAAKATIADPKDEVLRARWMVACDDRKPLWNRWFQLKSALPARPEEADRG
jgi:hypothetical protein